MTEIVHNDPADTVGPGQVLPVYIGGDTPAPIKSRLESGQPVIVTADKPSVIAPES
jgi:hypothetical protein